MSSDVSSSHVLSGFLASSSLGIYLRILLVLALLELVVGRIFLHVPQVSAVLQPVTLIISNSLAIIEVPIVISFLYIFWNERETAVTKVLLGLLSLILGFAGILYFFSLAGVRYPGALWLPFLLINLATIFVASAKRALAEMREKKAPNLVLIAFLILTNLTYFCIYTYFGSFSLSTYFGIKTQPIGFFTLAQNLILVDAMVLFSYALFVSRSRPYSSSRLILRAIPLPSALFALFLAALVMMPTGSRFDMGEITVLVLSMWGFAIPKLQVHIYAVAFWFFLVAALLLRNKGQEARNFIHVQEFTAVLLMFVSGFLNTLPYLVMNAIASILFSGKLT